MINLRKNYQDILLNYQKEKNEYLLFLLLQMKICIILCKNTQKFTELEEKLYNDYPQYSKSNNYFMINGNIVNKNKSLDENKIRNSDVIILTQNNI